MRHLPSLVAVALALVACPSPPPPASSSSSASSSGTGGHGGHGGSGGAAGQGGAAGLEPVPEDDAGGCPSMNGGQACATSADCPPVVGCGFCFACEPLPNGQRACVWYPLDAGFCDPL